MRLVTLRIDEFPGIDTARTFTFPQRITVVTGPNASGKSSMARAYLSLFTPHLHRNDPVSVSALFVDGENEYFVHRLHDKITWKRNERRFTPPWNFTPHDVETQYFTVHNLLAPSKVDDDLVQHVLIELTGGINLAGIAAEFIQSNRVRGQREAAELRDARAHLTRVRSERDDLARHEQTLAVEREQLRVLDEQLTRGALLETAQQYLSVTSELAVHERRGVEHDGVYEQLTPERIETLRSQLVHAQGATTRHRELQARRDQLAQAIAGAPHINDAETVLLTALDTEERLRTQRQRYTELSTQLAAHEQRLAAEQTATGVHVTAEYPDSAALQTAYDVAARTNELETTARTMLATIAHSATHVRAASVAAQDLQTIAQTVAAERAINEGTQRRRLRTTAIVAAFVASAGVVAATSPSLSQITVASVPLSFIARGVAGVAVLAWPVHAWVARRKRSAWQAEHERHMKRVADARSAAQEKAQRADQHEHELREIYQQLRHLRTNTERIAGPLAKQVSNHAARPGSHAVWLARVAELGNLTQHTALLREEHAETEEVIATLEREQAHRVAAFTFEESPTRRVLEARLRTETELARQRRQLSELTRDCEYASQARDAAWKEVTDTLQRAGVSRKHDWNAGDIIALLSEQEQRWDAFAAWRDRRAELRATQAALRSNIGAYDDLLTQSPDAIAEQRAALPDLQVQRDRLQQRISQTRVRVDEARRNRVVENARERVQRAEQALLDHRAITLQETALQFVYEDVMQSSFVEHEPVAFRRARDWFQAFTNGEFALQYDLGEQENAAGTLFARNEKTGAVLTFEQLSSGTISQLLLAVRLAYALEREADGKPRIPFVLDEALGTADEVRFAEIARSLELFSSETGRQLLYLSARQEDAEAWKRASADVGVITLQEE